LRPLVPLSRPAPGSHEASIGIEHEDRRRGSAALGDRRIKFGALLVVVKAAGAAMDDPDIILLVHPCADRPPQEAVVGKRLGPERIGLEDRGRYARSLRIRLLLEQGLADAETDNARGECCERREFPFFACRHRVLPARPALGYSPAPLKQAMQAR